MVRLKLKHAKRDGKARHSTTPFSCTLRKSLEASNLKIRKNDQKGPKQLGRWQLCKDAAVDLCTLEEGLQNELKEPLVANCIILHLNAR